MVIDEGWVSQNWASGESHTRSSGGALNITLALYTLGHFTSEFSCRYFIILMPITVYRKSHDQC